MSTSELSTVAQALETARLEFDFRNLNNEYSNLMDPGQDSNLNTSKKFKIKSDGKIYHGQIMIKDQCQYNATYVHRERNFSFLIENVQKFFVKYNVYANDIQQIGINESGFGGKMVPAIQAGISSNWKTFRGFVDIQFKPTATPIRELILKKVLAMSDPD